MVLHLHNSGAAQDLQQHGYALAAHTVNQTLHIVQCNVLELDRLAHFVGAGFLHAYLIAGLLQQQNQLDHAVLQNCRLKPKTHQVTYALGGPNRGDALTFVGGPKKQIPGEHGFKNTDQASFCFFEFFEQWQKNFKTLLGQIIFGDVFKTGLGVGQIPSLLVQILIGFQIFIGHAA